MLVILPKATDEFKKQFAQATSTLIASGAGDLYIQALESTGTIKVVETEDGASAYDFKTKTLSWNPNRGVAMENGDASAAAVLNHEFDHGVDDLKNPEEHKTRVNTPDEQYGTKEERRVIEDSEQKTAQALKEMPKGIPTRTNHKGQPYPTVSPTSTKNKAVELLEDKSKNKVK